MRAGVALCRANPASCGPGRWASSGLSVAAETGNSLNKTMLVWHFPPELLKGRGWLSGDGCYQWSIARGLYCVSLPCYAVLPSSSAHVFAHSQTLMCKCIPANVQHLSTGDHEAPRPMGSQWVRGVAPPACWRPREVKAPRRREVSPPRSRSRASQAVRGVGEGTARRLVSGRHCGGLTLREDGPRGRGGGRGSGEQAAVAEGCVRLCKQLARHPGRRVFIGAQLLTTRFKHSF